MIENKENKLLIIDIGNSYCKIALFKKNKIIKKILIKNKNNLDIAEVKKNIEKFKRTYLHGSIIGSVNPQLTKIFYQAILDVLKIKAYLINKKTKLNFELKKIPILKVGQDILALSQYCSKKNKNSIAFCFGTAIFAIIIKNKALIGASISIGLTKNLEALNSNTKLVGKVKISKIKKICWGINNKTALTSGIYHYALGFINSFYKSATNFIKTRDLYCVISGGEIFNKIKADFNYELNHDAILLGYGSIYWENQKDNLK